jgi:hypothetical protein
MGTGLLRQPYKKGRLRCRPFLPDQAFSLYGGKLEMKVQRSRPPVILGNYPSYLMILVPVVWLYVML